MVNWLLKLRWLAVVIAIFGALHSIAFVVLGMIRAFEGYRILFHGPPWSGEESPGIYIARSLDTFLLALVFLVFSIGVLELFAAHNEPQHMDRVPPWMRVKSLTELKFIIWEAILVALVVASVEGLVASPDHLEWSGLVLPIALLILALGLFLAKKAH